MKMSKGQIGRRLLGVAVAGMALITCGAAFADLGQPALFKAAAGQLGQGVGGALAAAAAVIGACWSGQRLQGG